MDGGVWMEDGCDRGRVDEGLGLAAAGTVMMGDGMSRRMTNLWWFAMSEIG